MSSQLNITQLKKVTPYLMKHKIVPFIWGAQGIGKTQVIKQLASTLNLGFVHLHLATQEVGDLTGLLLHNNDGSVSHARPRWFPTEGKGIIYLDELNRATTDVLNAIFSFITEGTIYQHRLPEGWSIIAAGNYQTNQFNVTDTSDSAWMSRFCHIDFAPTKEEFVMFAEQTEAHTVADFIRRHGEMLEVAPKERLNTAMITPDRRAWVDMIARLETEPALDDDRFSLYSGIVGPTAAASFLSDKKKNHERLSGYEVLNQFNRVQNKIQECSNTKNSRFDLLNSAVEEIFLIMDKKDMSDTQLNNFKSFIMEVPLEMGLKIINKLHDSSWKQKNIILNNKEFVNMFAKIKLNNLNK